VLDVSDKQLIEDLKSIYAKVLPEMSVKQKLTTVYRPLYAPVKEIFQFIDVNSSVFDIGCRTGPLLFLLEKYCNIKKGVGIDVDVKAIDIARKTNTHKKLQFLNKNFYEVERQTARDFNIFLCFDILHHIPRMKQTYFLEHLIDLMDTGDRLILKDLDRRPLHRALANQLTDVIFNHSVASYMKAEWLVDFCRRKRLNILTVQRRNKWVWNHYIVVAQK
jgi:2-polyprenyl-3-methyl-5-hydroxy-6-metoxy-1,4-benzoquinol methylase